MTTEDLTWIEIGAEAYRQGYEKFGDWIKEEQGRREEARAAEAKAPIVVNGFEFERGVMYDITYEHRRWDSTEVLKTRKLKGVRVEKSRWSSASVSLVYPATGRSLTLYGEDVIVAATIHTE